MIDSHCHLDLDPFKQDWEAVLHRAKKEGLTRLLIPGTHPRNLPWQRNIFLAASSCLPVDLALGVHPYFITQDLQPSDIVRFLEAAFSCDEVNPVAIGEIGLDGHIDTPMKRQKDCLNVQIQFAQERQLPIILHHRKTHHLLFEALKETQFEGGGVIHAFSGSKEVAQAYIDKGFYLGFGGTITYARGAKTKETLAYVFEKHPERILIETDAPDMPMQGRQGERNSPEYLGEVISSIAKQTGATKEAIDKLSSDNYYKCFGLSAKSL
ncbi:TatD family deoxyribonuclease [Alteromonas sp. 345S023]|uniref:TatD family deoxyribonuclease n=1 Tax=Alteromonas profundi TaxID=2696062 RepID=A0A7X5LMN6_9ALTE|nr:TatD family deoxyribonuclease [Alteromonas profundi]